MVTRTAKKKTTTTRKKRTPKATPKVKPEPVVQELSEPSHKTTFSESEKEAYSVYHDALSMEFEDDLLKHRLGWLSKDKRKEFWTPYVEWHAFADRLDEIDPMWSYHINSYSIYAVKKWDNWKKEEVDAFEACVVVTLTIGGLTKDGMGTGQDVKSAEHDAFKRACCHFNLGRYIYGLDLDVRDADGGGGRQQRKSNGGGKKSTRSHGGKKGKYQMKDPDAEATMPQRKALESIAYNQDYDDVEDFIAEFGDYDWEELTKGDASKLIAQAQEDDDE